MRITPKSLYHAGSHAFFSIIYGEKRAAMLGNPIRTGKYNEFRKLNFDTYTGKSSATSNKECPRHRGAGRSV